MGARSRPTPDRASKLTARDADQHDHAFGWREQRDPNAFFDTSVYLAANPDVQGVDLLGHSRASGWKEGLSATSDADGGARF